MAVATSYRWLEDVLKHLSSVLIPCTQMLMRTQKNEPEQLRTAVHPMSFEDIVGQAHLNATIWLMKSASKTILAKEAGVTRLDSLAVNHGAFEGVARTDALDDVEQRAMCSAH